MRTVESLLVVTVVVVFVLFNFYVVRELSLLRADVSNINVGLSDLRRESYRVADLQVSNAVLMGNISALEHRMDILAAFTLAVYDGISMLANSSHAPPNIEIVTVTKRPTGTPFYNIPDGMKSIQNLSESIDQWNEFCFQERRTNTTLCYRKVVK